MLKGYNKSTPQNLLEQTYEVLYYELRVALFYAVIRLHFILYKIKCFSNILIIMFFKSVEILKSLIYFIYFFVLNEAAERCI